MKIARREPEVSYAEELLLWRIFGCTWRMWPKRIACWLGFLLTEWHRPDAYEHRSNPPK